MNNDQTPERFEDRLLGDLNALVAQNPSPVSDPEPARRRAVRPARRFALAGTMALALAAAAAVVVATGDPETAYAVDKTDSGAITVEVRSLADAEGLESKLRAAGLNATVNYNANSKGCEVPPPPLGSETNKSKGETHVEKHLTEGKGPENSLSMAGSAPRPGSGAPEAPEGPGGIAIEQGKDGAKFTINPGAVPKGAKLMIDANLHGGLHSLGVGIAVGDAPELNCK